MKNRRLFYFLLILTFVYGLYMPDSNVFAEALNPEVNPVTTIDSEKVETKEAKVIGPDGSTNSSANVTNEASISPQNDVADISEKDHSTSIAPAEDVSKQQANSDRKEAVPDVAEEKEAQSVTSGKTGAKGIFLNGESGDDRKDGLTKETAVKTFEEAKKKIDDIVKNIYITGTTNVEGDISLKDKDSKIIRDEGFNGYLLKVGEGKTATLKNITIDGNSDENKTIENSLVYVDGGTLNIEEGAVLRNNKIKKIENTATRGGAVYANNATVNMTGGLIEENQATYGGGVYLHGSTMDFSGGKIQNNRSDQVFDKGYSQYYSAGGGIAVNEGSTLTMSGGAEVLNNSAAEIGGGISLGTNQQGASNHLYMTGGTIDGNTAGASGGGLFIQGGLRDGNQSIAEISAGKITNNTMNGKGVTDKAFGGGGIYVNGVANPWTWQGHTYYGANGELHIKNVLITDNKADIYGAGMACCPISKTTMYVNNGAALYGNHAVKAGNELFIYSDKNYFSHSGEAKYKLSKWMLGGAPFNWMTPDGVALREEMHEGTLSAAEGGTGLLLDVNSKGNELTKALTKVIISGNSSATCGGGIGSNGTIVIGTDDKTTEVKVVKKWDDGDNANSKRPNSVEVQLLAKIGDEEYLVETKKVSKDDSWKATFSNLPVYSDKGEISYFVKEVGIKGYESTVTGDKEKGFTITNKEKPEIPPETPPTPPTRDIHIVKKWDLVGNEKPVARIEVELYRDGKATGKVLELNESNNWSGSFTGLEVRDGSDPSRDYIYTVKERGENGGFLRIGDRDFDVSYEGSMDSGFVITNKEKPEVPPETPPEEPEKPGKPNEPETPETPDVPDKPDKPNKPGNPGAPQTGDGFDMNLWAGLASLSVAALGFIGTKKRRDEE